MRKSNKQLTFLVACVVLMASTLLAQPNQHSQQGRQQGPPPIPNDKEIVKMVENLSSTLSLNDKQEAEIADIYQEHFAELKALTKKTQNVQREAMDTLKKGFDKAVKSVLTDEQKKGFETYLKNHGPGQDRKQGKQSPKRK